MTVGEVLEVKVAPSELSQPWPKEVWPVPPLATESVPVMSDKVVVAVQVGTPFKRARTLPAVVVERADEPLP